MFFFFKQKTAYEMRISDWSSDVCSSDLHERRALSAPPAPADILRPARVDLSPYLGHAASPLSFQRRAHGEIGRASCRERVVSVRVDLGGRRIITKKKLRLIC